MSFQTFKIQAAESILFAQFAAETAGVTPAQIQLWVATVKGA